MLLRVWCLISLVVILCTACSAEPGAAIVEEAAGTCRSALDCVWAVRIDDCCDCGSVYPRSQAESDNGLVILELQGGEYRQASGFTEKHGCLETACAACMSSPLGLVCEAGACREAIWWNEKLQLCLSEAYSPVRTSCLMNTAVTAYLQAGTNKGMEICELLTGEAESAISYQEFCRAEIGRAMSEQQPEQAVEFCRSNLESLESACIVDAARVILAKDAGQAYLVCYQIEVRDARDQAQRDACMLAIALDVAERDRWLALKACNRMEAGREACRASVLGE